MFAPTKSRGYTLYELLMTLALIAVMLSVGVPSFGRLAADNRLRTEADALFHAVHLARKESIARRRVVSICPSLDGSVCEPTMDWSAGWIMFVNKTRRQPLRRDDDEELLRYHVVSPQTRIVANRRGFTLRSTELRATNGTIVLCDRGNRGRSRALVISYTGRPRVARQDQQGRPWNCAH